MLARLLAVMLPAIEARTSYTFTAVTLGKGHVNKLQEIRIETATRRLSLEASIDN
jgi:hypothetical protein